MRIGVWHDLPSGGGRRAFEDHVAGLAARGHEIVIVYPDRHEAVPMVPSTVELIPTRYDDNPRRRSWEPLPPIRTVLDTLRAHRHHVAAAASALNAAAVDVVWVNSSRAVRAVDLAPHVDAPNLLYLQEPYRWFYEALPQLPWISHEIRSPQDVVRLYAWRRQARMETAAVHAYDRVLVNSLFSRESVLRAYGRESTVCRLGVDSVRFCPGPDGARGDYVVSLGAMTAEKRHVEVVQAVSAVHADVRPSVVVISNVADETYAAEVEAAAAAGGVALRMLTSVSDDVVVETLQKARALVYCPRLEPFGLAPLEAASTATPVVAVAEGGVRETVVHGITGLLVDAADNLGDAITRIVTQPEDARRMGESGRRVVLAEWTVGAAARNLERNLREVVERKS